MCKWTWCCLRRSSNWQCEQALSAVRFHEFSSANYNALVHATAGTRGGLVGSAKQIPFLKSIMCNLHSTLFCSPFSVRILVWKSKLRHDGLGNKIFLLQSRVAVWSKHHLNFPTNPIVIEFFRFKCDVMICFESDYSLETLYTETCASACLCLLCFRFAWAWSWYWKAVGHSMICARTTSWDHVKYVRLQRGKKVFVSADTLWTMRVIATKLQLFCARTPDRTQILMVQTLVVKRSARTSPFLLN